MVRLYQPTAGHILFEGRDVAALHGPSLKDYHRTAQFIFKNPYNSINPRFTIQSFITEPLVIHGIGTPKNRINLVCEMLKHVRLSPPEKYLDSFPHQLSGGERQRVVIARALILQPKFLVADEPASMLDVSIRAGVLELLEQIAGEFNLTTMYISHDLSLLRYMCKRLAVMYLGKIVEAGPTDELIANPAHPYTRALVAAVPVPDPDFEYKSVQIKGTVPSVPTEEVPGCIFAERCPEVTDKCRTTVPPTIRIGEDHVVACHLASKQLREKTR
jgi:peptide/nickel transport system ATP-binding protein